MMFFSTLSKQKLFMENTMFGFDIYNFYSIAPSLAIVAAMVGMSAYGVVFIRQQIAKDGLKAESK